MWSSIQKDNADTLLLYIYLVRFSEATELFQVIAVIMNVPQQRYTIDNIPVIPFWISFDKLIEV